MLKTLFATLFTEKKTKTINLANRILAQPPSTRYSCALNRWLPSKADYL